MPSKTFYHASFKDFAAVPAALFSSQSPAYSYCLGLPVAATPGEAEALRRSVDRRAYGAEAEKPGNVYGLAVEVGEGKVLLEWEKPVNAQGVGLIRLAGCNGPGAEDHYSTSKAGDFYARLLNRCQTPNMGYDEYEDRMGTGDFVFPPIAYVTDRFRRAGFVGIQFSNSAVIFDPAVVRVTHKNGVELPEPQATVVIGQHTAFMGLESHVDLIGKDQRRRVNSGIVAPGNFWTFTAKRDSAVQEAVAAQETLAKRLGFVPDPSMAAVAKAELTIKHPLVINTDGHHPAEWIKPTPQGGVDSRLLLADEYADERGHDAIIFESSHYPDETCFVVSVEKHIKTLEVVRNRAQRIEATAYYGSPEKTDSDELSWEFEHDGSMPLFTTVAEGAQYAAQRGGEGFVTTVQVVLKDPLIVPESVQGLRESPSSEDIEAMLRDDHDGIAYRRADGSYSLLVAFDVEAVTPVEQTSLAELNRQEGLASSLFPAPSAEAEQSGLSV